MSREYGCFFFVPFLCCFLDSPAFVLSEGSKTSRGAAGKLLTPSPRCLSFNTKQIRLIRHNSLITWKNQAFFILTSNQEKKKFNLSNPVSQLPLFARVHSLRRALCPILPCRVLEGAEVVPCLAIIPVIHHYSRLEMYMLHIIEARGYIAVDRCDKYRSSLFDGGDISGYCGTGNCVKGIANEGSGGSVVVLTKSRLWWR